MRNKQIHWQVGPVNQSESPGQRDTPQKPTIQTPATEWTPSPVQDARAELVGGDEG